MSVAGPALSQLLSPHMQQVSFEVNGVGETEAPLQPRIQTDLDSPALRHVEELNCAAECRWSSKLSVQNSLTRSLVSFQANKGRAVYRC